MVFEGAIGLTGRSVRCASVQRNACLRTFGWKSAIHRARPIKPAALPIKISEPRAQKAALSSTGLRAVLFPTIASHAMCEALFRGLIPRVRCTHACVVTH